MTTFSSAVFIFFTVIISVFADFNITNGTNGVKRKACNPAHEPPFYPVTETKKRLHLLREQMLIRSSLKGPEIDAYILSSFDEHLNENVAAHDSRLQFLTGFKGPLGLVAITLNNAAFWTEERYLEQANGELDCEWELYDIKNKETTIIKWLSSHLTSENRVGADPHLIPHYIWRRWSMELGVRTLSLIKVNTNLVDLVWKNDRPRTSNITIKIQELRYAGEKWQSKITELRDRIKLFSCDAMIVTSLTEIAYILNIRGRDIPHVPVVKSYLIVTPREIYLYTEKRKVTMGTLLHLKGDLCHNDLCVIIKEYDEIWEDLRTYSQAWKKILVPAPCVWDKGVSEAVFSTIPSQKIYETPSPIIFMRAQKNFIEREGMRIAHIRDGAAMCEAMSNLEGKFHREKWTELKVKYEVERSRLSQPHSKGLSLPTIIAFGKHGSLPYYAPSNVTDIEVTDQSTLVIESGGQYLEGTTDVSRTYHFGEPTDEQKQAYTYVLSSIITLSNMKIPANLHPSEIDPLLRSPAWHSMQDYPHGTGHGIGSYLSVKESPIDVSYTAQRKHTFQDGYFFINQPGYYKANEFGIRLANVLEVVDTGFQHPSGEKFLAFKEVTLVPYEPKLIDHTLLSLNEKRWLNQHNAKIRELVGQELKRQGNMVAFYWMMNKTRHILEYIPEKDIRSKNEALQDYSSNSFLIFALIILHQILRFTT